MNGFRPDQFLEALLACFREFDNRSVVLGRTLAGVPADEQTRAEWLEYHARRYVLDHFLSALGWDLPAVELLSQHLENVQLEAGIASISTGHRRFLDYLGCERASGAPALLLEAKRPSLRLSVVAEGANTARHPFGDALRNYLRYRDKPSDNFGLSSEWCTYLDDVADYVRSVKQSARSPQRVVISNGEWIIAFVDPDATFCRDTSEIGGGIMVYQDRQTIVDNYADVFRLLSYKEVCQHIVPFVPQELSGYLRSGDISVAMHAVRVTYSDRPGNYRQIPCISVSPILVLLGERIGRVLIETRNGDDEFVMPLSNDGAIREHCEQVSSSAIRLKSEVEEILRCGSLPLIAIEQYFGDDRRFSIQSAVVEHSVAGSGVRSFVILTGAAQHFLVNSGEYTQCPFHSFQTAMRDGVHHRAGPLEQPTTRPKCFFPNSSAFHCAHRDTAAVKVLPVTEISRERAGPRSASDGEPFCEIWRLDEYLCCRSCVYQHVCSFSELFSLPCPSLSPPSSDASSSPLCSLV
jgi:hypothetical protein